jgi:hypothetical protein
MASNGGGGGGEGGGLNSNTYERNVRRHCTDPVSDGENRFGCRIESRFLC